MRGFSGQRASGAHMRMGADTFITRETPSQWIAANGSRYRKSDLMEVCTRGGQRYFVPLLNVPSVPPADEKTN